MTLGLWPEAVPFDPDSGTALHELRKHFDAAQLPAALLLVCGRSQRGSLWAQQAAIGLARALAGGPRPVVLVDLDFEGASLHERLNEANGEGLANALLFGASLERVTLRPAGEAFEFVPPGAFAPDPSELLTDPGWVRLLAELATRNALLLAWAPVGTPGLNVLAERIQAVVVLAEENEVAATVALMPESIRVEGMIRPAPPVSLELTPVPQPEPEPVPPAPPAATPEASLPAPEAEAAPTRAVVEAAAADATAPIMSAADEVERIRLPKDEAREALMAELRARQRVAARAGAGDGDKAADGTQGEDSVVVTREPAPPRNYRTWFIGVGALLLIVILSALGGMLLGGGPTKSPQTLPPVNASGPPEPAGEILGYSVAVESYDRQTRAQNRADTLALAEPNVSFYLAPVRVDQDLYFRVLAGPFTDSLTAAREMHTLVDRGLKTANSPTDIRSTPLAFLIGRYDTRDEALQKMNELKTTVPSYVVEVPYSRGPMHYHVYAGAFAGETEALVMRDMLKHAGVQDTLVLRVGRAGT